MADVASKQQTTALFLPTIVISTRRRTDARSFVCNCCCFMCNCYWLTVCIVVVVLCVLLSYMNLLYCVGIVFFFTLDTGLLARSQYSEGPATGPLDTGFSWFPCA